MYKGKIYGSSVHIILIVGVRVGACKHGTEVRNQAISFETEAVRNLLIDYVVNEVHATSWSLAHGQAILFRGNMSATGMRVTGLYHEDSDEFLDS